MFVVQSHPVLAATADEDEEGKGHSRCAELWTHVCRQILPDSLREGCFSSVRKAIEAALMATVVRATDAPGSVLARAGITRGRRESGWNSRLFVLVAL